MDCTLRSILTQAGIAYLEDYLTFGSEGKPHVFVYNETKYGLFPPRVIPHLGDIKAFVSNPPPKVLVTAYRQQLVTEKNRLLLKMTSEELPSEADLSSLTQVSTHLRTLSNLTTAEKFGSYGIVLQGAEPSTEVTLPVVMIIVENSYEAFAQGDIRRRDPQPVPELFRSVKLISSNDRISEVYQTITQDQAQAFFPKLANGSFKEPRPDNGTDLVIHNTKAKICIPRNLLNRYTRSVYIHPELRVPENINAEALTMFKNSLIVGGPLAIAPTRSYFLEIQMLMDLLGIELK